MSYGVPVLARDIPGNSFLDEKTGLKFSSEAEFTTRLEKLLQNEKRRDEIGMNGYFYIKENHSTEIEGDFYRKMDPFSRKATFCHFCHTALYDVTINYPYYKNII